MLTFDKGNNSFKGSSLLRFLKMTAHYTLYSLFLQAIFLNLLFASPVGGQDLRAVNISLSAYNVPLEDALQQIEKYTDFNFIYNASEVPLRETVTIDAVNESLYNILCSLAAQRDLTFQRINHQIVLKKPNVVRSQPVVVQSRGSIQGKITDGATREPLIGANIMIKGTTIGTTTDAKGYYRLENIKADSCTLLFQYVGYLTKVQQVRIVGDRTIEVNVVLEQGAYNLNEITITGSISDRTIKESANPITILTPRDLENRNLNSLGDVLQTVPGVVSSASVDGFSVTGRINDGSLSSLNIRGFSPGSGAGSAKFLVDGVEIYDFRSLSYFDPNQIEKIEVTRGPMSSTLYGAGSSGGIVQIFTKKGKGKLKVNFKTMLTSKESKYQDRNPFDTEYSVGINGGQPSFGYTLSFDYQRFPVNRVKKNNGIPEQSWVISSRLNGTLSNVKADLNVRYSKSERGSYVTETWYKVALAEGWENPESLLTNETASDSHNRNTGINVTLNFRQPVTKTIYHNLSVGISNISSTTDINSPTESGGVAYYSGSEVDYKKSSAKYFVNMNQYLFPDFKIDITGGGEYISTSAETFNAGYSTPYDDNGNQEIERDYNYGGRSFITSNTAGLFAEAVWGYKDKLFLTTGFRAEKNSSYGDNTGWYKTPRVGLTYIIDAGVFTFKPRVSWGKSTQPVRETAKLGSISTSGSYTFIRLPNPDLEPETQAGYEVGTDIFYTKNYSFGITYYNQRVANLMENVNYESDDVYTSITKYVNVAEVLNRGFELEAKAVFNAVTVSASGTISQSKYGEGFDDEAIVSNYREKGKKVMYIPSGTFFLSLGYRVPKLFPWSDKGGNVSVNYMWRGSQVTVDLYNYYKNRAENGITKLEYRDFEGYYSISARADYWLLNNLSLFVDVTNLLNNQDIVTGYPRSGRRISFGFNCHF